MCPQAWGAANDQVDGHSRYRVGWYALPAPTISRAGPRWGETFRGYGVPQARLMDGAALGGSEHYGRSLTWLWGGN